MKPLKKLSLLTLVLVLSAVGVIALAQEGEQPETPAPQFDLPITRDVTYVVQPRDNLDGIGAFFDVSVDCLREQNNISRLDILRPGTELLVSVECPPYTGGDIVTVPRTAAREVTDGRYFVQQNDTLDTIAQRYNVSVEALAMANDITEPGRLSIGQLLTIPEDAPPYGVVPPMRVLGQTGAGTDADNDTEDEAGAGVSTLRGTGASGTEGDTYVVQRNDTLDTIGQELNVSVEALYLANNIEAGFILLPGDVLTIPADAPPYGVVPPMRVLGQGGAGVSTLGGTGAAAEGETYVVQPNDTLDTIAQELNISVVSLAVANDIPYGEPFTLLPGDVLTIPDDAPPYGDFGSLNQPAGAVIAAGEQYVIQVGDTIDTIGQRLNVDRQCIIDANQIAIPRAIRPGQVIGIPESCPAYSLFSPTPAPVVTPAAP